MEMESLLKIKFCVSGDTKKQNQSYVEHFLVSFDIYILIWKCKVSYSRDFYNEYIRKME